MKDRVDRAGLGTRLRHLVELLDGDVERRYRALGVAYRPRYTAVVKVLDREVDASIRDVADAAGITHSAASQTVRQMQVAGLVEASGSDDARERRVRLTAKARRLLPALRAQWAATNAAAEALERELARPLSATLDAAIEALERRSFYARIGDQLAASPADAASARSGAAIARSVAPARSRRTASSRKVRT
jgi:DNA-binding MarR family transcriptional regulator